MDIVCLGVNKRILIFIEQGPRLCRLSNTLIGGASNKLLSLNSKLLPDFACQPHSLSELDRWKKRDFRQFLLYTGPFVLKTVLYGSMHKDFLFPLVSVIYFMQGNC